MSNNSSYRWIILVIVCIGIFAPSYAQYQLPPLAPQIINDLKLTPSQFSSIFTAPMIPAIFLSIMAGLMADKFGIKRVIAVGMLITTTGAWLRIISNGYSLLFISMALSGFGAAFLNTNGAKVIGYWFPPEKIGAMMGIFLGTSTIAMTAGMGTTALLKGINIAYTVSAVVCTIAFILWVVFMKIPKKEINSDSTLMIIPISECLKKVLKNRTLWLVGICLMFILGANVIISSFLPSILAERNIDRVSAGAYGSAVTIGNLLGCLFIPVMAGRLGKNKILLYMMAVVSSVGAVFSWQAPQGIILAFFLCVTGIAMGGLMPILMSMPIQLPEIGPVYAGTAGGFIATLQLLGAVVIPTYIVGPIAGTDLKKFFVSAGICMILVFIAAFGLPELGMKNSLKAKESLK